MICLGLVLSTVGLDLISGAPRLVFFDLPGFYAGIGFLVLAIGIYGVGEVLWTLEQTHGAPAVTPARVRPADILAGLRALKTTARTMISGSVLGFFVGTLPAAGATPASLMAYGLARSASKTPERFGKGAVEGVVAPEAANNAASTGSLLPMLTLGIPGSPTTALLLGGMVMWGLTPGPLLFANEPAFVWGLISSLYTANVLAVIVNLALIPVFVWVLRMPFSVLCATVLVLCIVGGYAPDQRMHDVWLIVAFGLAGYLLRKCDYPLAPLVLALVLGPIMERSLRQALISARGDPMTFLERPISAVLLALALGLVALPRRSSACAAPGPRTRRRSDARDRACQHPTRDAGPRARGRRPHERPPHHPRPAGGRLGRGAGRPRPALARPRRLRAQVEATAGALAGLGPGPGTRWRSCSPTGPRWRRPSSARPRPPPRPPSTPPTPRTSSASTWRISAPAR